MLYFQLQEYRLNGLLTQGETISDIGGIKLAYYAYLESTKFTGEETRRIQLLQKYTKAQLFWLAAGAIWCSNARPSTMEEWRTRAHPPDEHRVNSAVSNNVELARDFQCPIGSPMNPSNKCIIWYYCVLLNHVHEHLRKIFFSIASFMSR